MAEVLKALQELNVCWKKIGHYNMKCRWAVVIPGHHGGMVNNSVHGNNYLGDASIIENEAAAKSSIVKFELQVVNLIDLIYAAFRLNELFNYTLC
jgi:5'-AMP-activated protein kinase catalytic alpha subunit